MNLRLSILLVAVLLLFGGSFLVLRFAITKERAPEEPWLFRVSEDTITHIEVRHAGNTVNYDRNPGGTQWYIQGEPDIPVFLEKWSGTPLLLSGPRVNRKLADAIDAPPAYGLEPPQSVVRVTDRGGQTFEFHLGIPTPDEANQYARLVGHSALFTVPAIWAQVVNRLATEPPYLRLFQLKDDEIVSIEVTDNGRTVVYGIKPGGQWYVLEPKEVPVLPDKWADTPKMLAGPRADQVLAEKIETPAEYGLDPPQTKVRLSRAVGADVEFHLGKVTPNGEHRYARVAGEPELFAMPVSRAQIITDLVAAPPYGPAG